MELRRQHIMQYLQNKAIIETKDGKRLSDLSLQDLELEYSRYQTRLFVKRSTGERVMQ
ncbi:hypothetical protein [Alteribacter populi]|uniref:hypothetical protein n=1 Tax=Alteribacter populi TaxID=2011011 RepID=UPI0012FF873E|nr:hypothetical protein [Alteribacter populi]